MLPATDVETVQGAHVALSDLDALCGCGPTLRDKGGSGRSSARGSLPDDCARGAHQA